MLTSSEQRWIYKTINSMFQNNEDLQKDKRQWASGKKNLDYTLTLHRWYWLIKRSDEESRVMIRKFDLNIAMWTFFIIIYDVIWLSGPISVLFLDWKIKIFLVKMNALYMVVLCLIQFAGKLLTWNIKSIFINETGSGQLFFQSF